MSKKTMTILVSVICMIAKTNIACASGFIGYQPEVPHTLLEKGESND